MSIDSGFVILAFGVPCICWVMTILVMMKCPTCDSNEMDLIPICETETYRLEYGGDISMDS
jgi:hypothetical protein